MLHFRNEIRGRRQCSCVRTRKNGNHAKEQRGRPTQKKKAQRRREKGQPDPISKTARRKIQLKGMSRKRGKKDCPHGREKGGVKNHRSQQHHWKGGENYCRNPSLENGRLGGTRKKNWNKQAASRGTIAREKKTKKGKKLTEWYWQPGWKSGSAVGGKELRKNSNIASATKFMEPSFTHKEIRKGRELQEAGKNRGQKKKCLEKKRG